MNTYTVENTSPGPRLVHDDRGRLVAIPPKSKREHLGLADGTAIMLRRGENRGSSIRIVAESEAGEAVLQRALVPPAKRGPFRMVHGAADNPNVDRDELADVEQGRALEAALANQPYQPSANPGPTSATEPASTGRRSRRT